MVHQNVKFISRLLLASLLAAIVMGLSTAPIDILTLKYNWITVAIFLVVYLFAIYLFYRIYLESVTNNHFKITKIAYVLAGLGLFIFIQLPVLADGYWNWWGERPQQINIGYHWVALVVLTVGVAVVLVRCYHHYFEMPTVLAN
ncbi:hypothetical protein WP50_23850 [Lactiplantibacillus plantarum]|nr:hypothetical protein WP50_23850 [Lactiplantibacillus plantarum]